MSFLNVNRQTLLALLSSLSNGRAVPSEPIITTGHILRVFSERAFEVSLPNGKKVVGHPAKALAAERDKIVPGVAVRLEMTPFDFEKARIAGIVSLS